ncbi:MAG TPA: cation:proton antiporter [Candidatus Limnocylindria bacterium]|nr:cation:proton antiporter [Candidatus Limnocylindria bacterium]
MPENILVELFVLYASARVLGALFERFGQPEVVGQLAAGAIVGPHLLGWVAPGDVHATLAELGVVVLLFVVGLETPGSALRRVGRTAASVAVLGAALPLAGGTALMLALGRDAVTSLFVGVALMATSVGVTAAVLARLGALERTEARIILAAAVVDDVIAMLALAAVTSLAAGALSLAGVIVLAVEAAVFLGVVTVFGARTMRRYEGALEHWFPARDPVAVAFILLLGLAALSVAIGLAAIIGAFIAGVALADVEERYHLRRRLVPALELLVPFFFVVSGTAVDLPGLADPAVLPLVLVVTAVAIATKVVGCALPAAALGRRGALLVGVGMVPRGEMGFVVAGLGLAAGVLDGPLYGVLIAMAALTTLAAPPAVARLLGRGGGPGG